ncbi:hypothetical protein CCY99_04680 [Helicobacter sp. 16-1353]|uniref:glycosyltransferase 61 family protein n=1 Tax=Helicobacter sp. 16-1353 TaxID=2004996 RepID=UPI000DCC672A|nr:glycosyltransferase family 61 protein [Helicobacter sp. 16-1353]RAX53984.1 hypothetical protein CCY99_04680 [Helicobacter sp. 16-1353]
MQEYFEVNISNLIDEDSKEYKSLMDENKHSSLQDINTKLLNTRGRANEPVKLSRNMKFKLSPFDILHFDNIEIVTTSGGAFSNGKIIQENTGGFGNHGFVNHNYNFYKNLSKRFFIPLNAAECKQVIKILLSLFFGGEQRKLKNNKPKILYHSPNWDCFSHFSFEEFPRLLACLKALYAKSKIIHMGGGNKESSTLETPEIDFDNLIIIAPIRNSWQFNQYIYPALLSLTKEHNPNCPFAIRQENIICVNDAKIPKKMLSKANNVFIPTQVKCNKKYLVSAMKFLREFYYDENFKDIGERIYISRAKSAKRFLSNEVEFRNLLENKYGFKTIYMEEISFKDKINILSRAKVLLSIDGTSIMNYGYMKSGTKAIALRASNMAEYPIDSIFGVEFLPIVCEIDNPKDTDHMDGNIGTWWASNLIADIPYVESKLQHYGVMPV